MIAPLAKLIDWSALQVVFAFWLRCVSMTRSKWKLEEALEFLNGPDFIPAASDPVQIEFDGPRHFKFPTPRPCEDEENNIVYGQLYQCAKHWQQRPVIILVDASPAIGYHTAFPWLARRFNRAGFNAAALVPPYQLQRRPRRPIEGNLLDLAQTMAQNVAEIRALTGWLLEEGCPSVGLGGAALGGWLAGLTACSEARIAAVVLIVPGVRMCMWRSSPRVVWRRVREAFQALRPAHEAMDTTRLNLLLSKPLIPKENILLMEGIHEVFADPQEAIEELWQKWHQPEIWRLPHGHISWMFTPGLTSRVLRWLAPRLDSRLAPTEQK
jgi:Alpha/beta hydrolase domain containing 18